MVNRFAAWILPVPLVGCGFLVIESGTAEEELSGGSSVSFQIEIFVAEKAGEDCGILCMQRTKRMTGW